MAPKSLLWSGSRASGQGIASGVPFALHLLFGTASAATHRMKIGSQDLQLDRRDRNSFWGRSVRAHADGPAFQRSGPTNKALLGRFFATRAKQDSINRPPCPFRLALDGRNAQSLG